MTPSELRETFQEKASGAGYHVFAAGTCVRAMDYILGLVKDNDVKSAVISDSPIADNLDFCSMFSKLGVRTMQTSIVKWVLQLAKGRDVPLGRVAEAVFSVTGERVETEPQTLLKVARRALKEIYSIADLGVTQADYGIAELGMSLNLESADNARLASALPRLHLTLLDYNHIVPNLSDLAEHIKGYYAGISGHKVNTLITYLTRRDIAADTPHTQGRTGEHILIVNPGDWSV